MKTRKSLIVFAAASVALVALAGLLERNVASSGYAGLNTDFDALAKPILTEVADSGWTNEAVGRHALPDLKRLLEDSAHKDAFASVRYLGKLRLYRGIGYIKKSNGGNPIVSVVADAAFEHGKAKMTISFVRSQNQWLLESLYVNMA